MYMYMLLQLHVHVVLACDVTFYVAGKNVDIFICSFVIHLRIDSTESRQEFLLLLEPNRTIILCISDDTTFIITTCTFYFL